MTPNRQLKNNFQPAGGVKERSLLHCGWLRAILEHIFGKNQTKNAPKRSKVKVSEHTYPVSIYILDLDGMGGLLLAGRVKVARMKTFTSEGQPSLWIGRQA